MSLLIDYLRSAFRRKSAERYGFARLIGKPLCQSVLPERNEIPFSFRNGDPMPEDVEVLIIRPELKKDVFRAVPLVEYFLNKIFVLIQLKANWPFVCLNACITLNVQPHRHILTTFPAKFQKLTSSR
jgi:hypothetical protein